MWVVFEKASLLISECSPRFRQTFASRWVEGGGHVDPENLCVLVDFDHKTADINHLYIKLAKKKLAVLATMFSVVDSEAVKL